MSSAPELVAESSWESPGLAADFEKIRQWMLVDAERMSAIEAGR